jgi:hypothetical protein
MFGNTCLMTQASKKHRKSDRRMNDFWEQDLTEEETDKLLEKMADQVRKRKLQVPAIMALEMHKPLSGVISTSGVVFAPFLVPFLGFNAVNDYSRLFNKRENVERLIQKIEMKPIHNEGDVTQGTPCSS